jgi:hypothetical protein
VDLRYLIVFSVLLVFSGFTWKRILQRRNSWLVKLCYILLAAVPFAGPVFYFLIDPPEVSPIAVSPEEFRTAKDPRPLTSFDPLLNSLRRMFRISEDNK